MRIQAVSAFIDWNSQLRQGSDRKAGNASLDVTRTAFNRVTRRVSSCLAEADSDRNFRVALRFYHGWHKGYEPSQNRKAITTVVAETDFAALSTRSKVTFQPDVGYGERLISALPKRMHHGMHLPNTLRDRGEKKGLEEKMVDTAMAADLVVCAYMNPDSWIVVAAEDDDIVPPIFAAESILTVENSRILLLSYRSRGKNFLKLEDIEVAGK
jgi:hypothetical protein